MDGLTYRGKEMVLDPKQKRRNRIAQKLADKRFNHKRIEGKVRYVRKEKYGPDFRTSEKSLSND